MRTQEARTGRGRDFGKKGRKGKKGGVERISYGKQGLWEVETRVRDGESGDNRRGKKCEGETRGAGMGKRSRMRREKDG